jgi:hypothetical protein
VRCDHIRAGILGQLGRPVHGSLGTLGTVDADEDTLDATLVRVGIHSRTSFAAAPYGFDPRGEVRKPWVQPDEGPDRSLTPIDLTGKVPSHVSDT